MISRLSVQLALLAFLCLMSANAGADAAGTVQFSSEIRQIVGGQPTDVAVGDFNSDGIQDLVVVNAQGYISRLTGSGDGTFGDPSIFTVGANARAIEAGDFNADGLLDVAVANFSSHNVSVLLGSGFGNFAAQSTYATGFFPESIAIGDFNADGVPDLVVGNLDGDVSILLGVGDGTFSSQTMFQAGESPRSVAVGDFDRDGAQDLAVANAGFAGGVSILLGVGDGRFGAAVQYAAGSGSSGVAIGHFSSSGFEDLVVANSLSDDVSILPGLGDGAFSSEKRFPIIGSGLIAVVVDDFNGDSFDDAAITGGDDAVCVLLGAGDSTLIAQSSFGTDRTPVSLSIGHLDNDLRPDLVTANLFGGSVSIFLNESTVPSCTDLDADGFTTCAGDCNDDSAAVHPGAEELPGNSTDENCDGLLGVCDPTAIWRNHGQFVQCVAREVRVLVRNGRITKQAGDVLIRSAAHSNVGK